MMEYLFLKIVVFLQNTNKRRTLPETDSLSFSKPASGQIIPVGKYITPMGIEIVSVVAQIIPTGHGGIKTHFRQMFLCSNLNIFVITDVVLKDLSNNLQPKKYATAETKCSLFVLILQVKSQPL